MEKKSLSQEGLKVIACITMLLDHIGAAFVSGNGLRIVGRIAFPIYCFLLSEGIFYTKNPKKYALRLLFGAILAEIPFDLLLFGNITLSHCSVMITLLLGFLYGIIAGRISNAVLRILLILPFGIAAELLGSDYGGAGVAIIAMFVLTRNMTHRVLIQTLFLGMICYSMHSYLIYIGPLSIHIEMFALLAMIPIACYQGRKRSTSRLVQWIFYLFYPMHLLALLAIQRGIF